MGVHSMWATPQAVADAVVEKLMEFGMFLGESPSVLESSCGDGAFLRALTKCGVKPWEILAVEVNEALAARASMQFPEAAVLAEDFLHLPVPPNKRFQGVGNPPFSDEEGLRHVEQLKKWCEAFAVLLPARMLEPCENRGDFAKGLVCVFPMYLRAFRDISKYGAAGAQKLLFECDGVTEESGQDLGGSSPTFLFLWCRNKAGDWGNEQTRIDFSLAERLAGRKAVAA